VWSRPLLVNFPEGTTWDNHLVYDVVADGKPVGCLWIGPHAPGTDLRVVGLGHRHRRGPAGKGFGREAMLWRGSGA